MADTRMVDLTKWYCEQAYWKKYGVTSPWSGKEAKMMQKCISYFDTNYGEDCVEKLKGALTYFLEEDGDKYIRERKHPFSQFAANPQRWIKTRVLPKYKPVEELNLPPRELVKETYHVGDDQEWLLKRLSEIDNPLTFIKGLSIWGWILKKENPTRFQLLTDSLKELVGRERAIEAWKDGKKEIGKIR